MRLHSRSVLALALLLASCEKPPFEPQIIHLEAPGAQALTAAIGEALPEPLVVRVVDQRGRGLAGVPVNWTVTGGGGSVEPLDSVTMSDGVARARFTAGLRLDVPHTVQAAIDGSSLIFSVEPHYPEVENAERFVSVVGDRQLGRAGEPLAEPIEVTLLTPTGAPAIGASIEFTAREGSGSIAPASAVTDSAGTARAVWTLGEIAGKQTAAWRFGEAEGEIAAATSTGIPTALVSRWVMEEVLPGHQSTVHIRAVDVEGRWVEGVEVRFTVEAGGGTLSPSVAITDTDGLARATWSVPGPAGVVHRFRADAAGIPAVRGETTTVLPYFEIASPPSPAAGDTVRWEAISVGVHVRPFDSGDTRVTRSLTVTVGGRTEPLALYVVPCCGTLWYAPVVSLEGLQPGRHSYVVRHEDLYGTVDTRAVEFVYAP